MRRMFSRLLDGEEAKFDRQRGMRGSLAFNDVKNTYAGLEISTTSASKKDPWYVAKIANMLPLFFRFFGATLNFSYESCQILPKSDKLDCRICEISFEFVKHVKCSQKRSNT